MNKAELTQTIADELIVMEKHRVSEDRHEFPQLGGNLRIPLVSSDKREQFMLDISRNRINLERGKYQNRARTCIVLVRLDFGGPGHRNPDDEEVPCPHIHVYREGWGDAWAYPIGPAKFSNIGNLGSTLEDFLRYCNVTRPPIIDRGLFV